MHVGFTALSADPNLTVMVGIHVPNEREQHVPDDPMKLSDCSASVARPEIVHRCPIAEH